MAKTKDQRGIAARRVRSLVKSVLRRKTAKAFAASKAKLEYYDLGWAHAAATVLSEFEILVKEHGFD